MSRRLRAIAQETMEIVDRGGFVARDGTEVRFADQIADAVAGTKMYLPDDLVGEPLPATMPPVIEVTGETTLAAARRLSGQVAALVFASARSPGGGFLNGAQAQEESLARASALYACQVSAGDFYAFHRSQRDLRYSDRVIYSPAVPVFRDDRDELLRRPYLVSFLTAAAPNLGAIMANQPEAAGSVPQTLRRRAARVLEVAAAHGHRRIVLGAWGCGVFGNDPAVVAAAFRATLAERPWFDHVVFAVHDRVPGAPVSAAFAGIFA